MAKILMELISKYPLLKDKTLGVVVKEAGVADFEVAAVEVAAVEAVAAAEEAEVEVAAAAEVEAEPLDHQVAIELVTGDALILVVAIPTFPGGNLAIDVTKINPRVLMEDHHPVEWAVVEGVAAVVPPVVVGVVVADVEAVTGVVGAAVVETVVGIVVVIEAVTAVVTEAVAAVTVAAVAVQ